jgi:hypothetical protein
MPVRRRFHNHLCAAHVVAYKEAVRGKVPTREEAKAQFETAWRQWLAWAKLREDT